MLLETVSSGVCDGRDIEHTWLIAHISLATARLARKQKKRLTNLNSQKQPLLSVHFRKFSWESGVEREAKSLSVSVDWWLQCRQVVCECVCEWVWVFVHFGRFKNNAPTPPPPPPQLLFRKPGESDVWVHSKQLVKHNLLVIRRERCLVLTFSIVCVCM